MIAIVDTGGANIASVRNALARVGKESALTSDPTVIRQASHVILPGVGAAGDSMERLSRSGLISILKDLEQPVLGICLGMQLLFDRSEEGQVDCLGILPGTVRRLEAGPDAPVPHMGWNRVHWQEASPLTDGIESGAHFYFVHSYVAPDGGWTIGRSEYRAPFPAIVRRGTLYGVQFHPERSAAAGHRMLRNFVSL